MNTSVFLQSAGLLMLSNVFMTFAWYAHLRNLSHRAWWLAALQQSLRLDYLWAALCMLGAVYFVFRTPNGVLS